MTKAVFTQFAAYNQWANAHLFNFALALPVEAYERQVGVFFKSLHGTLNHLLVADQIWLRRLTGEGPEPRKLDAILHHDRLELAQARSQEDERLIAVVSSYDDADFDRICAYENTSGRSYQQQVSDILQHLFNHQTHHRGQAHACCSIITSEEPPSLDLLAFQRGATAPFRIPLQNTAT